MLFLPGLCKLQILTLPPTGKLARAKWAGTEEGANFWGVNLAGTGPRCIGKNRFRGAKLAGTERGANFPGGGGGMQSSDWGNWHSRSLY